MVENQVIENENVENVAEEQPMFSDDIELRRLESPEVFIALNIASKIGINQFAGILQNQEFIKFVNTIMSKEAVEDGVNIVGVSLAFEVANIILSNIHKVENDVYRFLANLTGKKPQEIQKLDAVILFDLIVRVVTLPQFKDFLKVVSKRFRSVK